MKKMIFGAMAAMAAQNAFANPACAVCTVAIGATLSISRRLGVNDNAIAIWLGAFLIITGFWAIKWFDRHGWNFIGRDTLLMLLSFSMIGGVYIHHLKYSPCIIGIFYIDAFLFCAAVGGLIYIGAARLYEFMKARNGGHAHFPFEKVVVPLVCLLIASIVVANISL